ncbi:hypothetical protein V6N12_071034 [Hibiscus sabdariffa]|uniref:Uncharacterized protein n=1 Tax=Hibiscus sabdariffa TaxID=183260 RepID=A0ABR2FIM8_9ROSI
MSTTTYPKITTTGRRLSRYGEEKSRSQRQRQQQEVAVSRPLSWPLGLFMEFYKENRGEVESSQTVVLAPRKDHRSDG